MRLWTLLNYIGTDTALYVNDPADGNTVILAVYVNPPSLTGLEQRHRARGTETEAQITTDSPAVAEIDYRW